MPITFDGPNKIIQLPTDQTFFTAEYIYSRWKDWAATSDNLKFLEAFRVVGGDALGGGATAPSFVFLRNDYGWRIKKPEANILVTIQGNLVRQDPGAGFDVDPDGAFSPTLTINLTNVAGVDVVGALQGQAVDGSYDIFEALSIILAATAGKGGPDGAGSYRYRDVADVKDRIIAGVDGTGLRTSVALDAS